MIGISFYDWAPGLIARVEKEANGKISVTFANSEKEVGFSGKTCAFIGVFNRSLYRTATFPFAALNKKSRNSISAIAETEVRQSLPETIALSEVVTVATKARNGDTLGHSCVPGFSNTPTAKDKFHSAKSFHGDVVQNVIDEIAELGFNGIVVFATDMFLATALTLSGRVEELQIHPTHNLSDGDLSKLTRFSFLSTARSVLRKNLPIWPIGDKADIVVGALHDMAKIEPPVLDLTNHHYRDYEKHPLILLAYRVLRTRGDNIFAKEISSTQSSAPRIAKVSFWILLTSLLLIITGYNLKLNSIDGGIDFYKSRQAEAFYSVMPSQAALIDPVFQLESLRNERKVTSDGQPVSIILLEALSRIHDVSGCKLTSIKFNDGQVQVEGEASNLSTIKELQNKGFEISEATSSNGKSMFTANFIGAIK